MWELLVEIMSHWKGRARGRYRIYRGAGRKWDTIAIPLTLYIAVREEVSDDSCKNVSPIGLTWEVLGMYSSRKATAGIGVLNLSHRTSLPQGYSGVIWHLYISCFRYAPTFLKD